MKKQNGITMMSLLIYIMAFVTIIGVLSSITVFFNNNTKDINMQTASNSEYNKFNLYMLEYTENDYNVSKISEENTDIPFVTFSNGVSSNTFVLLENILYFNQIKLCENVDEFKIKKDIAENGKDILKTYLKVNGTVYTTDYVL